MKLGKVLATIIIAIMMLSIMVPMVHGADNIAEGTSGTCTWVIDSEGNLTVKPTSGTEGTLADITKYSEVPWYSYVSQIKTVKFQGKVKAISCLGLLVSCSNLTSVDFSNFDTSGVTNMYSMFRNCTSLKELDLSNLDTSSVTDMERMFSGCSKLESIDLSNFDTSSATNMGYIWSSVGNNLKKIKLGNKTNLKTKATDQPIYAGAFGRGTWRKAEDGKDYSIVEICNKSTEGTAEGTYTKISNISNAINIDFPVTYKINSITQINGFETDNPEMFEKIDNSVVIKNIPLTDTAEYSISGKVDLIFSDVVEDENKNKYDLKMTVENIKLYDLAAVSGQSTAVKNFIIVGNNITFSNYFYKDADSYKSGSTLSVNDGNVGTKYDVTMKILKKDGTEAEGSYIFSAYDLDVASQRDLSSQYKNPSSERGFKDQTKILNFQNLQ